MADVVYISSIFNLENDYFLTTNLLTLCFYNGTLESVWMETAQQENFSADEKFSLN